MVHLHEKTEETRFSDADMEHNFMFFFDNSKGLSVPSSTTMSLAPEALQVWSFEIMGLLAISKNLGFREANTEEGDPGILKSQFHEMFGHPLRCIC